jgi:two-component system sensor histidine kinase DesK
VALFVAVYLWFWGRVYQSDRPRLAIVILVVLCVIAASLSFVNFNNFGGLFIYCATVAGSSLQWRRSWIPVLAVSLLTLLFALIRPGDPVGRAAITGIALLGGMGMVGFNRLNVLVRELQQARDELARLAVAEERLRFARDLHDLLGHSLSVIVLKSELAGKLAGPAPERATREVQDIERVAREALREVRDAVSGYRQPRLEEEIEGARQALKAAGMSVKIERTGGPAPAPVEGVLAWALREGATNVLRHSRAHRVSIMLAQDHDVARLEILDDGSGAVPGAVVAAGSGLRGLGERVEARQGSVEFGPRAEGGFRLAVGLPLTLPLEAAAAE